MKSYKIVIIEDEELIREELKTLLVNAGYVVDCVINFAKTIDYIKSAFPDLILLDINLPEQDGYRLCSSIRSFSTTPILFITGRNTTMDELQALTLGGDDYITKPFSLSVLRARVNTQLRRSSSAQKDSVIRIDHFMFDFPHLHFCMDGQDVELSKTEQKLLYLLIENRGQVMSRSVLIDRIWSDGADYVDENALSVTVKRLRDKLKAQDYIKTIYGIGYSWVKHDE